MCPTAVWNNPHLCWSTFGLADFLCIYQLTTWYAEHISASKVGVNGHSLSFSLLLLKSTQTWHTPDPRYNRVALSWNWSLESTCWYGAVVYYRLTYLTVNFIMRLTSRISSMDLSPRRIYNALKSLCAISTTRDLFDEKDLEQNVSYS